MEQEQDRKITEFIAATGIDDMTVAREALEQFDWDLGNAILAVIEPEPQVSNLRQRHTTNTTRNANRPTEQRPEQDDNSRSRRHLNTASWIQSLLLGPLRYLTGINGDVDTIEGSQLTVKSIQSICRSNIKIQFHTVSYREALSRAARENKLLFIYLHSEIHPETEAFVNTMFCDTPAVDHLINERMISWAGSVEYSDGYHMMQLLSSSTFPCIAVLEPPASASNGVARLLACVQGSVSSDAVLQSLRVASASFAGVMAQREAQRIEATERQRLREEQDRELEKALEMDRKKAEEKERQAELARQQKAEEEARVKQAEQEAEAKANEQKQKLEKYQKQFETEIDDISQGKGTTVRFQFPDGTKFTRKFASVDTIQDVRDYVEYQILERQSEIENFALAMNFPKRLFGPDFDGNATVKDCDLVPQAVLFVQDLDS